MVGERVLCHYDGIFYVLQAMRDGREVREMAICWMANGGREILVTCADVS